MKSNAAINWLNGIAGFCILVGAAMLLLPFVLKTATVAQAALHAIYLWLGGGMLSYGLLALLFALATRAITSSMAQRED